MFASANPTTVGGPGPGLGLLSRVTGVVPDGMAGSVLFGGAEPADRVRVAVLIHERDIKRGRSLITASETPTPGSATLSEGEAAFMMSMGTGLGT